MRSTARLFLLCGCAALAPLAPAHAQPKARAGQLVIAGDGSDANPTARTVTLTVPLRDQGRNVGDLIIDIDPDDSIRVPSGRLLDLLSNVLDEKALAGLRKAGNLTTSELAKAGVALKYNAQELAVDLQVAADRRASRSVDVSNFDEQMVGEALKPAKFSGFLNLRSNLDYLHGDGGLQKPVTFLDGAVRLLGVVAEGEALWQPGESGRTFYRAGSRLVHDDRSRLMRWTAGDLQPVGRGFQSVPQLAGLSVYRSYNVLQPQRISRPRGDRSFVLTRPSTVEVQVNGQLIRRLQLEPGSYDLRDFPFTQGANDVRLVVLDDAGRSQVFRFNIFLDQSQLGRGLTEFGLYSGVLASSGVRGPDYTKSFATSGFIRHGFSENLTLGANFQGDRRVQMGGFEGIWSSPLGTVSGTFGLSNRRGGGIGHAALVTFQRVINRPGGEADSLNLFFEKRSREFAVLGVIEPLNLFAWEAGGGYSRALTDNIFAAVDGRYSRGRGTQTDIYNARGTLGVRISDALTLAAEARWERDTFERRVSGLITATWRIGRYSNARAEYDTRFNRARLSYSTFRGHGVGAYNIIADLDRSAAGAGANVTASYVANRAELGFSHFGSFEKDFGSSVSQRSSIRVGTALAFADGSFSIGRPVYDSFAVVRGHPSLRRASVEVDRTPFGYIAETGKLGTALHPALSSYLDRTIVVDAPEAPATADLGQGTFRLFPAYHSGHVLTVGSAYNVTAVGQLTNSDGAALSLITGTIREIGKKDAREVAVFTNREGRFGAVGLAPGRWQIQMNDEQKSSFVIDIPRDAEGVLTVGELRPSARSE
ncbi:MAG TPA: fimbrial biogenesis outer membrane usher protein [Sphingomicrobium sp.]|jgi:outer membrane usher protein